jgi:hypothetical protein
MAVTPTFSNAVGEEDGAVKLVTWALTTADPIGLGLQIPDWADRTVHFIGTWGGATAAFQGSNTDVEGAYGNLSNAAGATAITKTADGSPAAVVELPLFVRPKLTTVGAGAAVVCTLLLRRSNSMRT